MQVLASNRLNTFLGIPFNEKTLLPTIAWTVSAIASAIFCASNLGLISLGTFSATLSTCPTLIPLILCAISTHFAISSAKSFYRSLNNIEFIPKNMINETAALEKLATEGNVEAQYDLGLLLIKNNETEEAGLKWLEKADENNHEKARQELGKHYLEVAISYVQESGALPDTEVITRLFKKSADKGCAEAEYEYALCLDDQGTEEAEEEAIQWLQKAARQGYARAECKLGNKLVERNNLEDKETGKELIKNAAKKGLATAQCAYGTLLFENDKAKAFKWIERAANQEDADSINALALYYYHGYGCEPNKETALNLFKKAADADSEEALINLGDLFPEEAQINLGEFQEEVV